MGDILIDIKATSDYNCPYCGKSKLTPAIKKDGTKAMINAQSGECIKYHESSSEYDELEIHAFALMLECTNPDCKASTVVAGRLEAYPYCEDMLRGYDTKFTPMFFYPPIEVLTIPDYIPENVKKEIRRSYSIYFSDPNASVTPLRCSIECFLDDVGVTKSNSRETLHRRLVRFKVSNDEIATLLLAVKWLGNDGSHYNDTLSHEDVLKGYRVLLKALENYYQDKNKAAIIMADELRKGR